jgi:hypothetical protein
LNPDQILFDDLTTTAYEDSLAEENQRLNQKAYGLEAQLWYLNTQMQQQQQQQAQGRNIFVGTQMDVSISVWSSRPDGDHLLVEFNEKFRSMCGWDIDVLTTSFTLRHLISGPTDNISTIKTAKMRTTTGVIDVFINTYPILARGQAKYYILHMLPVC